MSRRSHRKREEQGARVQAPAWLGFSTDLVRSVLEREFDGREGPGARESITPLTEDEVRDVSAAWPRVAHLYEREAGIEGLRHQRAVLARLLRGPWLSLELMDVLRRHFGTSLERKLEAALGRAVDGEADARLAFKRCQKSLSAGEKLHYLYLIGDGGSVAHVTGEQDARWRDASLELLRVLHQGPQWLEDIWESAAHEVAAADAGVLRAGWQRDRSCLQKVLPNLFFEPELRLVPHHRVLTATVEKLREESPALRMLGMASFGIPLEIARCAVADGPVLVQGETGTGKENTVRAIHELSTRHRGPYVPVNVGAQSPDLAPSALFGHEQGAFTGADKKRSGAFRVADGGTLFLDEVSDVPLRVQVQLLRALDLDVQRIRAVGADEADEVIVDVRVVFATNRPLEELVQSGKMREDFYYRVVQSQHVELPPLRERSTADIRAIWHALVVRFLEKAQSKAEPPPLGDKTLAFLRTERFQGNVRGLQWLAREYVHDNLGRDSLSDVDDVLEQLDFTDDARPTDARVLSDPFDSDDWRAVVADVLAAAAALGLAKVEDQLHRDVLAAAIDQENNLKSAATLLGVPYAAFCKQCERAGIRIRRRRPDPSTV